MKQIEKQLKIESQALLPNEDLKQRIKSELFVTQNFNTQKVSQKKTFSHKKVWASAIAAVMVIAVALACVFYIVPNDKGSGGQNKPNGGGNGTPPPVIQVPTVAKQTYVFGAYSAGILLGSITGNVGGATAAGDVEEKLDALSISIGMVDSLMSNPPIVSETASDREGFTHKLTVTQSDLSGQNKIYIIYYNETASKNEDGEIESTFSGIIIIEGKEYSVNGEREKEGDEYEIKMTIKYADNKYVVFEQEIEEDEQSYEYTIYENGIVEKFSIEWEVGNYKCAEVEIEHSFNNEVTKFKYKLKNNSAQIDVTIKFYDETSDTVTVLSEKDRYKFSYKNGTTQYRPKGAGKN